MKKIVIWVLMLTNFLLVGLSFGQGGELDKVVGILGDKLAFTRTGDVLGVDENTIYISLGWQEGVLEGTKFEVVRLVLQRQLGCQGLESPLIVVIARFGLVPATPVRPGKHM